MKKRADDIFPRGINELTDCTTYGEIIPQTNCQATRQLNSPCVYRGGGFNVDPTILKLRDGILGIFVTF